MIAKQEYIEYLLSTPFNYTCTNMADHKPNLSHDVVSDFLRRQRFLPADLWAIVKDHIDDSGSASIIVDDPFACILQMLLVEAHNLLNQ